MKNSCRLPARVLKRLLRWVLLRPIFVAIILTLAAGILLSEYLHTPIWIYVFIFIVLVLLAWRSDKWVIALYKNKVQPPITGIYIDYAELERKNTATLILTAFSYRDMEIKSIDVKVDSEGVNIAKETWGESKRLIANKEQEIKIDLRVNDKEFINDAIGASSQNLELPLYIVVKYTINPVVWGLVIPEAIPYEQSFNYNKSPDYI